MLIAPGSVNTPLYRSQGQLRSMGLKPFEEQDRVVSGLLPMKIKPALDPQDIADTATFLVSDQARFVRYFYKKNIIVVVEYYIYLYNLVESLY